MVISDVLKKYRQNLDILDIELLLAFSLGVSRESTYTHPEAKISLAQRRQFSALVKRRSLGEPLAYLIQNKEFFGLDFYVDHRVLIPRPETEILVEEVIRIAMGKPNLRILDVGTGCGCIAVSLAKNLKNVSITGIDVSDGSLEVAAKNIERHQVEVVLKKSDLLEMVKEEKFDIIVSNLPYLEENDYIGSGVCYEPRKALFAGKSGVMIYEKLFKQINQLSYKPSFLLFEFGYGQGERIGGLVEKYFPKCDFEIKRDLAGIERVGIVGE